MSGTLDRLNLRPFERRLVVGVGTVLFIVLNMVFVWPYFGEYDKAVQARQSAERLLQTFQKEIAQKAEVERKIRAIESAAEPVPQEDQGTEFELAINRLASQSGVNVTGSSRMSTQTNQFFLERSKTVTFIAEQQQLVDFLYSLGSGGSLTRVRDITLRPDAPKQRLTGNVKIVASYQKKPPPRPAVAPATNAPAVKTAKPEKPPAKTEKAVAPAAKPAAKNTPTNRPATLPPPGVPSPTDKSPRK